VAGRRSLAHRRPTAHLVIGAVVLGFALTACTGRSRPAAELETQGRQVFESTCAACHGLDLKGTTAGPSFLDPIYASDHHADAAFYNAAANGVEPHHWNFGAMPPQTGITTDEVEAIIAYVRSRQREAGIEKSTPRP
jgi:mono/diheme cytochrome c family protein